VYKRQVLGSAAPASNGPAFGAGNLNGIARLIFTTYVFPFEVTSALLITAALGAMVLAHRERISPKPTQRDLSRLRVASGRPSPLPGPGTYARHNAVDMPALLPDGTPSAVSVSEVISQRLEPGVEATRGQQRTLLGTGPGGRAAGGDPSREDAAQEGDGG
jgi:NADH-quinone oxidoreductase subunit J